MVPNFLFTFLFLTAVLAPCAGAQEDQAVEEGVAVEEGLSIEEAQPLAAMAVVEGTEEGSAVSGMVLFEQTSDGLEVIAQFEGVSPGKHGFHIHENGDCSDAGKAAGGHYNPHQTDHGFLPHDGHEKAHLGDMGNVEIIEDGTGELSVQLPGVYISGAENNVLGLAVILHEKEDDFGQPVGNAGGRIGCGIIELAEPPVEGESSDVGVSEVIMTDDDVSEGSEAQQPGSQEPASDAQDEPSPQPITIP